MKDLLLFLVLSVISSEGRLIPINRTKVEEQQTDKPNPSIRLTRDIDDILMGFSNEEIVQNEEFVRSHNKRAKDFNKYTVNSKPPHTKSTRHVRDSTENLKITKKVLPHKGQSEIPEKDKKVLVKKPIPKFSELDYEDDFQAKMNRILTAVIESGEHEDEDFNVDDYDFDVNHDEYSGRGKPLEPRLNDKSGYSKTKNEPKAERKIVSKPIIPAKSPTKKGRSANSNDLPSKNREMDYYEDLTTVKSTTKAKVSSESEYEDDDSIDYDRKNSSIRMIRSWDTAKFANKFSGKSSMNLVKHLSILPLFPQIPSDLEDMEDMEYAANGNVMDPSRRII